MKSRINDGALDLLDFVTNEEEMQKMNIPSEYITKTEDVADQVKNRIHFHLILFGRS